MIDYPQIIALIHDLERQNALAEILGTDRTVHDRVMNAEFGEHLMHISESISRSTDVEKALRSIGNLFSESFLLDLLRKDLMNYAKSDLYSLPARVLRTDAFSGMILYQNESVSVSLFLMSAIEDVLCKQRKPTLLAKIKGVAFPAVDTLLKIVKLDSAELHKWTADKIDFTQSITTDLFCNYRGTEKLNAGDEIFLKGGEESCNINCISGSVLVLSVLATPIKSPVNVEYDCDSRALVSVAAADIQSSRIQMLSTFLRSISSEAAFDALPAMLNHRDHFVRWYVMREMLASEPERAIPYLRDLHNADPHPQVVKAASAALQMVELK